ncbi:MAG: hypothetical protein JNL32_03680 [Candidatus Kapabacteria bacterium]|nr:hypothetical protein [Candidatus Kapabacteria bacterium]
MEILIFIATHLLALFIGAVLGIAGDRETRRKRETELWAEIGRLKGILEAQRPERFDESVRKISKGG